MDYINFLDVNIKCLKNAKENIIDGNIQSYVSIVRELSKYNLRNSNFPIQEIQNQIRDVYKSDNVFLINELQSKIRDLNLDNDYIISNLTQNEDYKNFFKHLIILLSWFNENDIKVKEFQSNEKKILNLKNKKIIDFIFKVADKETFLYELKNTFKTEKGKSIKGLIYLLTKNDIIIYGNREFKTLFNELSFYFNRDIGTYTSINDYKIEDDNKANSETILNPIEKKLKPILIKHLKK